MKTNQIENPRVTPLASSRNYNGKFTLKTEVKGLPDFTLKVALLNEFFYTQKDAFYIRLDRRTNSPEAMYKNLTSLLRKLNNERWRREPVSGFRLCNVQQTAHAWRLISNVALVGSRFASVMFERLSLQLCRAHTRYVYVTFRKPRRTLEERAYLAYYTEFYERSHYLNSVVKIEMLERYYWRFEVQPNGIASLVQILFDIFEHRVDTICTDPLDGVEISQSPNIDSDDYFATARHLLSCRIRFFQPFGGFYKLLKS